jgi:hypothetical protein
MHFGNEISVVVVSSTASGDNDYGDTTVTEVRTTVERVLYAPRSSTERTDPAPRQSSLPLRSTSSQAWPSTPTTLSRSLACIP